MNYEITFRRNEGYVHAKIVGKNTQETVVQYMQDVRNECESQDCYRVLIEENLTGPRLDTIDIFDMIATGSREMLGVFEALAYVDTNAETGDMAEFAETVAVNRGIPAAAFTAVEDARNWLNRKKVAASE